MEILSADHRLLPKFGQLQYVLVSTRGSGRGQGQLGRRDGGDCQQLPQPLIESRGALHQRRHLIPFALDLLQVPARPSLACFMPPAETPP